MSTHPILKRMLDAGLQFTEMSREQADKMVKEFVRSGQAKRKDREVLVEQLLERGRAVTEGIAAAIQREVGKHLATVVARLDEVEDRVEDLAGRLGVAGGSKASARVATSAPESAPATKAKVKQAPAKKAPAKKSATKKTAAKKAPAKKSATKKAPAKKSAAPAAATQNAATKAPATSASGAQQA